MQFGFYLPHNGPTAKPDALKEIAELGDRLGFHAMVVGDHILVPGHSNSQYPYSVGSDVPWGTGGEHLEQLTELAFLAGVTQNVRIVPSVMIVPYRHPILTAKMLATMDYLSNGRLILGVGVGWLEEEFEALDAPAFSERGAVTNEYLQAFIELWTNEAPKFEGKYVSFSDISIEPRPVQKPHPPIWVGGQSRPAMRRAVEIGNAWHPIGATPASPLEPDEMEACIEYMKRHSERIGRDTYSTGVAMKAPLYDEAQDADGNRRRFSGTAEQVIEDVKTYAECGVSHLSFDVRSHDLSHTLERLNWLAQDVMAKCSG